MDAAHEALQQLAAGRTLSRSLARDVMEQVMSGTLEDVRFGALFGALHARGETIDELAGFAETMRAHVVRVEAPDGAIDTCGTGGDGADTFNVSTTAAFVTAGAGATVAKHGNRAVSSRCGSADVLEALGGTLETSAEQASASLAATRFAFLFAPAFHPSMRHAAAPRRALGVRTAFNFLGPITNPAGVSRQVVGVSDRTMASRIAEVLHELGSEHALVVHGADGLDELTLADASIVHEVTPSGISTREITPEQLGLTRAPVSALAGGDASRNAQLLLGVLSGTPGPMQDVVLLNAAAGIVVAGLAADLHEGVDVARAAIRDGAAAELLGRWIEQAPVVEGAA